MGIGDWGLGGGMIMIMIMMRICVASPLVACLGGGGGFPFRKSWRCWYRTVQ